MNEALHHPLVVSGLTALLGAAAVITLWPQGVFQRPALGWGRRSVLCMAVALVWLGGSRLLEAAWNLPAFNDVRPESYDPSALFSVGRKLSEALLFILPFVLIPSLRKSIRFRIEWTWTAAIFAIPIAGCLSASLAAMRDAGLPSILTFTSYCMLVGVTEETLFRGYAFQVGPHLTPIRTLLVTSLFFAFLHWGGDPGPLRMASAFFCGVGLGIVRLSTGSIGLCILIHGTLDVFLITSTPDAAAMAAFAASTVLILLFHRRRDIPAPGASGR